MTRSAAIEEVADAFTTTVIEILKRQTEDNERPGWVTAEGLARRLGCEVGDVYDLRRRGLPAHKLPDRDNGGRLSKRLWVNLSEVETWFEQEAVRS